MTVVPLAAEFPPVVDWPANELEPPVALPPPTPGEPPCAAESEFEDPLQAHSNARGAQQAQASELILKPLFGRRFIGFTVVRSKDDRDTRGGSEIATAL
jgi:hypothetical protein